MTLLPNTSTVNVAVAAGVHAKMAAVAARAAFAMTVGCCMLSVTSAHQVKKIEKWTNLASLQARLRTFAHIWEQLDRQVRCVKGRQEPLLFVGSSGGHDGQTVLLLLSSAQNSGAIRNEKARKFYIPE
jgi:hypothetical protein